MDKRRDARRSSTRASRSTRSRSSAIAKRNRPARAGFPATLGDSASVLARGCSDTALLLVLTRERLFAASDMKTISSSETSSSSPSSSSSSSSLSLSSNTVLSVELKAAALCNATAGACSALTLIILLCSGCVAATLSTDSSARASRMRSISDGRRAASRTGCQRLELAASRDRRGSRCSSDVRAGDFSSWDCSGDGSGEGAAAARGGSAAAGRSSMDKWRDTRRSSTRASRSKHSRSSSMAKRNRPARAGLPCCKESEAAGCDAPSAVGVFVATCTMSMWISSPSELRIATRRSLRRGATEFASGEATTAAVAGGNGWLAGRAIDSGSFSFLASRVARGGGSIVPRRVRPPLLSLLLVSLPSSSGDGERPAVPGASIVPRRVDGERLVASSTRQRFVEPFSEPFERLGTPPRDASRSATAATVLPAAMVVTSSSKRFRCDRPDFTKRFELRIFELSDLSSFGLLEDDRRDVRVFDGSSGSWKRSELRNVTGGATPPPSCSSTAGFLLSILPVSLPSSSGDGERRVRPMRGGASIVPRRVESERFVASSTRQRFVEPPERLVTQRFVEAFERLVTPPRDTFRSAIAAIVLPAAMVVTSSSKRFRCDLRVELCIFELCIFELSDLHIFGAFATASPSSGVSAAGFSGCAPASVNILILLARASAVTSAAAALSIR